VTAARAADKVDFVKQILPILKERCFECHGPKKQKGKLRLDQPKTIAEASEEDDLIVAGKADESEIYTRITLPADDDDVMPAEGDPLTDAQKALFRDWINQGASLGDWQGEETEPEKVELIETLKAPPAAAEALSALQQSGALAMPLAANTNLINVDFRNVEGIDKADGSPLAKIKSVREQLTWLSVANSKVPGAALANVAGLPNLTRLHLENTPIDDAALAHLKDLNNLQYLNLHSTQVTDAGLAHLKGLKNLRKLYVWQTKVTKAGAADLKTALPEVDVNLGWEGPPATQPAKDEKKVAAKPINANCPFTNKPIDAKFTVVYKGQTIGLCCDNCRAKFAAEPAKFIEKVKEFKPPA
jgi:YHS domain-containing protein